MSNVYFYTLSESVFLHDKITVWCNNWSKNLQIGQQQKESTQQSSCDKRLLVPPRPRYWRIKLQQKNLDVSYHFS
jgi:hypothetical protein